MDRKTEYSSMVSKRKSDATNDDELYNAIGAGERRAREYGNNWEPVDINEVVDWFVPHAVPEVNRGKMQFSKPGSRYIIIADIGGGYLRIYDTQFKEYVGLNGERLRNYTDSNGKQHGRSRSEYNRLTHFRIRKKGK